MTPSPRTWLITGAGRGLGRAVAEAALATGDTVVATVRTPGALADLVAAYPGRAIELVLDVRDREQVRAVVQEALERVGHLDVVVNNAGYGLIGAIEEVSEQQVRELLDTVALGALWVTQAVMPRMRARGTGHVVQISTVGAVASMPTLGLYNAAKWALEGFSEALAAEVAPFGVRVTLAELGGFATEWATSSMRFAAADPAYDELRTSLFGTALVPWPPAEPDPTEPGPEVAAAALLAHVDAQDGPLRLLVGDQAPGHVAAALELRREDYARDHRFTWPSAPSSGEDHRPR